MPHKSAFSILILFFFLLSCTSKPQGPTDAQKKVVIGYVFGTGEKLEDLSISANKLTHINYAFVNVKDSMAFLANLTEDTANLAMLNALKKDNPDLKILIAIGGWSWSENFSDAVLTESSRKKFARSCVDIVVQNKLDGVDIDWEYPGQRGEDNVFRPEDKQNYTLMFKAIRDELDSLTEKTDKRYELTTAVGASSVFLKHTEMDRAAQYLDYVNLMTYDFCTVGDTSRYHANLYPSEDYSKEPSVHRSVSEFLKAGVPAEKLVMGVPFYGRGWIMQSDANHGINMPNASMAGTPGFSVIKDSISRKEGVVRYWDANASAPYLFNQETNYLLVYDDEEAIALKCDYVKQHNLAGIMFWQYSHDPEELLLSTIHQRLQR